MIGMGIGAATALGTAFSWAISSTVHAAASRLLGVHTVLMMRQTLAVGMLTVLCLLAGQFGWYAPWAVWLAFISGVLGVVICDWCLFEAVLRIGIRPALVCHSLYSCCTALLGVVMLHEYLGRQGIAGILIATAGVILVIVAEQRTVHAVPVTPKQRNIGIALALTSAVVMALGMILSKEAMRLGIPPLMLSWYRNVMAAIVFWVLAMLLHNARQSLNRVRECPSSIRLLLAGCLFGPVLGIWLSSVALNNAPAAVASTIIGLQPVALLLVSGLWERRCPTVASIIGSCTACAGAALLLLR